MFESLNKGKSLAEATTGGRIWKVTQMVVALVICAFAWGGGVYWLHQSFTRGDVRTSGSVIVSTRDVEVDQRTGEIRELSFVEAKALQLLLLTLTCGAVGTIFIVRALKREQ